ncbi:MAG: LiaI-LiaF-like domain-containing protein, partial [Mucilaginibacter sp.]
LLNNLDLLPDWDFWKIWPVVLIVIGCAIMFSGEKKKPQPFMDASQQADDKKDTTTDTETNPPADTPPAV